MKPRRLMKTAAGHGAALCEVLGVDTDRGGTQSTIKIIMLGKKPVPRVGGRTLDTGGGEGLGGPTRSCRQDEAWGGHRQRGNPRHHKNIMVRKKDGSQGVGVGDTGMKGKGEESHLAADRMGLCGTVRGKCGQRGMISGWRGGTQSGGRHFPEGKQYIPVGGIKTQSLHLKGEA